MHAKVLFIFQFFSLFFLFSQGARDRCRIFEFRCSSGHCIPSIYKCNGRSDCLDGSDEICETSDAFTCSDHKKISKSNLCDGKIDCSNDEDTKICDTHKCSSDGFLCRSTPMSCININAVCNNIKDCSDDSDESPEACEYLRKSQTVECNNKLSFRCANKQLCISHIFRCDGNFDCTDKSDEINCNNSKNCQSQDAKCNSTIKVEVQKKTETKIQTKTPCREDEFYCGDASPSGCISKDWQCDSSLDCAITNKDEENCTNFRCPPNKPNKCSKADSCYENEKTCDGYDDCDDKSDEENCKKPEKIVVCDQYKEFKCVKNNTCITLNKLCDGINDCNDLSDERPGGSSDNCNKYPCKINNGGCEQGCSSFFFELKCFCRQGYQINPDNDTRCIDIDECADETTCSHKCINLKGSFKCECFTGFYATNINGSLCMAVGEKFLLYSSKNSIRELRLLHHYMEVISNPIEKDALFSPVGIDFDYNSKHVFWTQFEPTPEIIQIEHSFAKTKTFPQKSLVNKRIHSPVGLAYDWIHGLLFWTDIQYNEISVLNITSGMRRLLLKLPNTSKVRSIVVHPKFRTIYWTDWGLKPKIESMGMDGHNKQVIIEKGLITPNGLALDYNFNDLYWIDAKARKISSYNLKSKKLKDIVTHLDVYGFDIDVFEDWIYLSDWHKENIIQIHKKTGEQKVVISSPKPMGVKLFHQLAQDRSIENVCINNPCQNLCLPSSMNLKNTVKFRCLCPDYSYLLKDNITCSPVPNEFSNSNALRLNKLSTPISKVRVNVFLTVGLVTTFVILVLIIAVGLGIFMYRNYMRKVIKRATNFNNPTYYHKTSIPEIQVFKHDPLLADHDVNILNGPSRELIPRNMSDDGLQMVATK